jgi:hypothetical protein
MASMRGRGHQAEQPKCRYGFHRAFPICFLVRSPIGQTASPPLQNIEGGGNRDDQCEQIPERGRVTLDQPAAQRSQGSDTTGPT